MLSDPKEDQKSRFKTSRERLDSHERTPQRLPTKDERVRHGKPLYFPVPIDITGNFLYKRGLIPDFYFRESVNPLR